ncbi:MAG: sugar ABC transporter permease, partial [Variovorax sp.]
MTAVSPGARSGARSLAAQERRFAFVLLAPALAVLLLVTTVPLVYLAWNSLHRIDLGMPWMSGFAGLDNYTRMGSDPRFWNSLWLTVVYTASTVALQVIIGLSLALLVLQIPKGQGLLRVGAILPIVLAPVVVGLFWRTLVLAPDVGLVDVVTRALGLGSHNWLGDPQLALISVIAIHTWQWTPFAFLVLLATLSTLPGDIYEAARLDRAGAWQRFWYITLPLIRPAIVMVVIMRMMTALSAFAAIFAATGGGPGS